MNGDACEEAACLYESYVKQTGFSPPSSYADLLLFVELSGASVAYHAEAPDYFHGLQFGQWIIVGGSPKRSDRQEMLALAHEWCHWLRRRQALQCGFRLYEVVDEAEERMREEKIAVAFARLF